jgi:hypothetical protein
LQSTIPQDVWAKLANADRVLLLQALKLTREQALQRFGYLDGAQEAIDFAYPAPKGSTIRSGDGNN